MIKTVSLTADTETKVEISGGYNVGVVNYTTDMLYASRKSGISAGADDVAAIPAGDSYVIRAADDTVYLLATAAGNVQLESLGVNEVFKIAATRSSSGGGGTVDEVARQAISNHANNDEIHLTAEKAIEAAATMISNPNQLINPDFKINQRGQTEYSGDYIFTADRWTANNCTVTINDDHITIEQADASVASELLQRIEADWETFAGKTMTISAMLSDGTLLSSTGTIPETEPSNTRSFMVTDDNKIAFSWSAFNKCYYFRIILEAGEPPVSVKWVKLELGKVATPFIPPNPATELAKCQRYYQRIGKAKTGHFGIGYIGEKGTYANICTSLPTSMRTNPTVTLVGTLYISTSGHTGSGSLPTSEWSGVPSASPNYVSFPLKIGGTESIAGQGCTVQNRDGTSYIELSAEL